MKQEYRVVSSHIHQGETLQYEVCLVQYEETAYVKHTSRTILGWEPVPNIFQGQHNIETAKKNAEERYQKVMEAFNKPVLQFFPETLKEARG
jgi:hypothetical protein